MSTLTSGLPPQINSVHLCPNLVLCSSVLFVSHLDQLQEHLDLKIARNNNDIIFCVCFQTGCEDFYQAEVHSYPVRLFLTIRACWPGSGPAVGLCVSEEDVLQQLEQDACGSECLCMDAGRVSYRARAAGWGAEPGRTTAAFVSSIPGRRAPPSVSTSWFCATFRSDRQIKIN